MEILITAQSVMLRLEHEPESLRGLETRGGGVKRWNSVPRRSRGHYCIILILTARVSELRRDEVELSNRLRTDDANRRSGMESSRET